MEWDFREHYSLRLTTSTTYIQVSLHHHTSYIFTTINVSFELIFAYKSDCLIYFSKEIKHLGTDAVYFSNVDATVTCDTLIVIYFRDGNVKLSETF